MKHSLGTILLNKKTGLLSVVCAKDYEWESYYLCDGTGPEWVGSYYAHHFYEKVEEYE